jgi:hypothetical protein
MPAATIHRHTDPRTGSTILLHVQPERAANGKSDGPLAAKADLIWTLAGAASPQISIACCDFVLTSIFLEFRLILF